MTEQLPHSTTRPEWQTREGCMFVSDVMFRVLDDIADRDPPPYQNRLGLGLKNVEVRKSAVSLWAAARGISRQIPNRPNLVDDYDEITGENSYGVRKEDLRRAEDWAYGSGIAELEFTWHFAPALASAVVDQCIEKDLLDETDVNRWRLSDWADVIGSPWFSRLAHAMAYTGNGVYTDFGQHPQDFSLQGLRDHLAGNYIVIPQESPLFAVQQKADLVTTQSSMSVLPSKALREQLHGTLKNDTTSAGCPVARFSTKVFTHMIETDPHTAHLLQTGRARIVPERSDEHETTLQMEKSPIDASLELLAKKLRRYESLHGNPVFQFGDGFDLGVTGHTKPGMAEQSSYTTPGP